jgi:hypothetical protein
VQRYHRVPFSRLLSAYSPFWIHVEKLLRLFICPLASGACSPPPQTWLVVVLGSPRTQSS